MKTRYKYLITFIVGFAMALAVAISRDLFSETDMSKIFAILADAFTIPAVLITGFGGLMFISNEGGFDALSYGLTSFFDMFRKEKRNKFRTFYDYKESRAEKNVEFGYLLISGLAFIAITAVMLVMYNRYL